VPRPPDLGAPSGTLGAVRLLSWPNIWGHGRTLTERPDGDGLTAACDDGQVRSIQAQAELVKGR